MSEKIFIGTDSGATTSKIAAVWENGEAVSTKILQRPTNSQNGREAVIAAGLRPSANFWRKTICNGPQVQGVGLAIPGPYERYGVLGKAANLPASFAGWDVHADYSAALAKASRPSAAADRWATTAIAAAWPRRGSRAAINRSPS